MREWWMVVIFIIVAFGVGWLGHKYLSTSYADDYVGKTMIVREKSSHYQFTQPLLFIDNSATTFTNLNPLKRKLEEIRADAIRGNEATNVSVYFRDLNTTSWTGVNEEDLYDPASMLKVVLLLVYFREAEHDKGLLDKKFYYSGKQDGSIFFTANHELVKGRYYTVKELIDDMIIKSGNDSASVLLDHANRDGLSQIYEDLGLTFPEKGKLELVSARVYSRLFRVLYSSTYLAPEVSEEVLKLLTQVEFKNGLSQGVPPDVPIAHKFGERTYYNEAGEVLERQLHDCGIVYYQDSPYFLCVMTKGADFDKLSGIISRVSKVVYDLRYGKI